MSEVQKEILEAIETNMSHEPAERIDIDKLLLEWVTSVTVKEESKRVIE